MAYGVNPENKLYGVMNAQGQMHFEHQTGALRTNLSTGETMFRIGASGNMEQYLDSQGRVHMEQRIGNHRICSVDGIETLL